MGFASHSVLASKQNRSLLRKRQSYSDIRETYEGFTNDAKLHFKELTPFEQKKIRDKIIAQAKKDRLQEIFVYLLSLFLVGLLVFGGYMLLSN